MVQTPRRKAAVATAICQKQDFREPTQRQWQDPTPPTAAAHASKSHASRYRQSLNDAPQAPDCSITWIHLRHTHEVNAIAAGLQGIICTQSHTHSPFGHAFIMCEQLVLRLSSVAKQPVARSTRKRACARRLTARTSNPSSCK